MKRLVATLVLAASLAPLLAAPPAEACYKYNPFCSSSRGRRNIRTRPSKPKPTPAPAGTLSIEQTNVDTGDLSDLGVDSGSVKPTNPADIGPAGTLNIPQSTLLHGGESADEIRRRGEEQERLLDTSSAPKGAFFIT